MASFGYAALDQRGREQRGVIEADSSRQVRQLLRDRGLTPLRIETAAAPGSERRRSFGRSGGARLRIGELALVTRQLATLLQAALPLEEALAAVARQAERERVANLVRAIRTRVMEGHTLAASLGEFPAAFPALYRATVAAGEHAGHLDLVLERLADYSESAHASRQKVRMALLYPVLLLVVAVGIVAGLMTFVVPSVVDVIAGQGQALPLLTRGLIGISALLTSWGWLILLLLLIAVLTVRVLLRRPALQLAWHRRLLRLPLLGRLSRGSNSARFASTLSTLTRSGVPLVDALQIAGEVLSNHWLRQSVVAATQQVREGSSLNRALERSGYFPPIMVSMIASGEMSGELGALLERVAQNQQRDFDDIVGSVLGILEPVMLLVMGAVVLLIVVAILQPIFTLNQLL